MRILSVIEVKTVLVETVNGEEYRRNGGLEEHCWEKRYGSSWEPCFNDETYLEDVYQQYLKIQRL